MDEPKPPGFPWRGMALTSAGALVLALAVGVGAFLGGVRLERAGEGRHHGPGFAEPAVSAEAPRPLDDLPPDRRRAIREQVGQAWRAAAPHRAESVAAREAVMLAAAREPYDPQAMRDALAAMRAADAEATAAVHAALAEGMAALTPDERLALLRAAGRGRGRGAGERDRPEAVAPETPPAP